MKQFAILLLLGISQATYLQKKIKTHHKHRHHHQQRDWDADGEAAINKKDYINDSPDGYKVRAQKKTSLVQGYPSEPCPGKLVDKTKETEEIDHMEIHSNAKQYRDDAPKAYLHA